MEALACAAIQYKLSINQPTNQPTRRLDGLIAIDFMCLKNWCDNVGQEDERTQIRTSRSQYSTPDPLSSACCREYSRKSPKNTHTAIYTTATVQNHDPHQLFSFIHTPYLNCSECMGIMLT